MSNIEVEAKTLYEITGQESGIVVYDDRVIVLNWAQVCPNGGMPVMDPTGIIIMEWPGEIEVLSEDTVSDICEVLPGKVVSHGKDPGDGKDRIGIEGMELLRDEFLDIPALWGYDCGAGATIMRDDEGNLLPTAGYVYKVRHSGDEAIVIAPEGWN